jgi:short-subunit dehydrogenase
MLNGVYGASKAYLLALTQSMQHELSPLGVRVQVVLPGATATELWDRAGHSVDKLPAEIVMSTDEMVDAALAGLDLGETVTIPSLPDAAQWEALEAARKALGPNLSRRKPAARYLAASAAAA